MTDQGKAGGMRKPGGAEGMMVPGGAEGARSCLVYRPRWSEG